MARETQRQFELTSTVNLIEQYYVTEGRYPEGLHALVPEYLSSLPKDAATGDFFLYSVSDDGQSYEICAPQTETSMEVCRSSDDYKIDGDLFEGTYESGNPEDLGDFEEFMDNPELL